MNRVYRLVWNAVQQVGPSVLACVGSLLSLFAAPAFAATATNVPYLDANGNTQTAATATVLTSGGATTLTSGFYVCQSGR